MQKCPRCGFRKMEERRLRDEDGRDRGSRTVCSNCDSVIKDNVDDVIIGDEVQ
ncbi:MAG: hypothetical protein ACRDQ5_11675 [Sciscionella sp.]